MKTLHYCVQLIQLQAMTLCVAAYTLRIDEMANFRKKNACHVTVRRAGQTFRETTIKDVTALEARERQRKSLIPVRK